MILKNIRKQNKGFTLVESLVAISILMVAIVIPMSIAQNGLNSATYSKDQMTAAFLAQDAIEYIKNKRDEIGVTKDPLEGSSDFEWIGKNTYFDKCFSQSGCSIDTVNNKIESFDGSKLTIKRTGNGKFLYYGYENNNVETSKFTRKISIATPNNNNEAKIEVIVSWQNGENIETVQVTNFLYNYWENL